MPKINQSKYFKRFYCVLILAGLLSIGNSCKKVRVFGPLKPWTGAIDLTVNGVNLSDTEKPWWIEPIHYSLQHEEIVCTRQNNIYSILGYAKKIPVLSLSWTTDFWNDGWFFLESDTAYFPPPNRLVGGLKGSFILRDSTTGDTIRQMDLLVGFSGVNSQKDTTLSIDIISTVDTAGGQRWGLLGVNGTIVVPKSSFK